MHPPVSIGGDPITLIGLRRDKRMPEHKRPLTRTAATEAAYLREGERHVRRAKCRYPDVVDPVAALVMDFESNGSVLRRSTVGVYRQECRAVIRHLCIQGSSSVMDVDDAITRIDRALKRRTGTPAQPRAASRKVNDPSKRELRKLLAQILAYAKEKGDARRHLALGATLFFVSLFGCRLIELSTAVVERDRLVLRNAKYGNGRAGAESRAIKLGFLSETERHALPIALHLLRETIALYAKEPGEDTHRTYERWHRAAAEMLARCCKAAGVRRLNLYSLRHVAIATWRQAGLTPVQIAALAGHASIVTARRHYGHGSSGWSFGAVPTADIPAVTTLEAGGPEAGSAPNSPQGASAVGETVAASDLALEEFPTPSARAPSIAAEQGARHFQAWRETVQGPQSRQLDAILARLAPRDVHGAPVHKIDADERDEGPRHRR